MDPVDDEVGPHSPVWRRPHAVGVPGRSGQARCPVGLAFEQELAFVANEVVVQMRRMDCIGAPFTHWGRLVGDAKTEPARPVPDFYRFHKRASRENAVAHRADAAAVDFRSLWVGDTSLEQPVIRFRQWREGEHQLPYHLLRRINHDLGLRHANGKRRNAGRLGGHQRRKCRQERDHQIICLPIQPRPCLDRVSDHGSQKSQEKHDGRGHQKADGAFDRHRDQAQP
jgi:hypothetical protein